MTIEHVSVNDGKYTVVLEDGNLHALRYGEPWGRDLAGDNLVYWLAVELAEARAQIDTLSKDLQYERNNRHIVEEALIKMSVAANTGAFDGWER